jgi:large subunit ribosomal protein L9
MAIRQTILLLEDVEDLGKRGEVVSARRGYARNFLLPQRKGVVATKHTLLLQEKLKAERAKLAEVERKESESLAALLEGKSFTIDVKVDPEGRLYGSVASLDITRILEKENIILERKAIQLKHPIKETGVFAVPVKLKEGVTCTFHMKVVPEVIDIETIKEIVPQTEEKVD